MKKLIAGALVLAMTIAFAGCGSASPTDVAESFLQAIKANDTGALQGVYAGTLEETGEGEEEIAASKPPKKNLLLKQKLTRKKPWKMKISLPRFLKIN